MAETFGSRLKHAWNAFIGNERPNYQNLGVSSYYRPDRPKLSAKNEKTIVNAILNRIRVDCASTNIYHARLDDNDRMIETIDSGLNNCLTVEANMDQTSRAFIQDIVLSMFDEGYVAIVPVDTTVSPKLTGAYDIQTMRTGKVIEWYPAHVKVRLYNEKTGKKEEVVVMKKYTALIENPFYTVMNEQNSILQRLIRKLNLLDVIDEQSGSGKLDLIIQLPYIIKTDARRQQAENRRKEIENQLAGSKYGIAYTDGTEKITQLNRSVENNLMSQIEFLTSMLYGQLGVTKEIMDGTANDEVMQNYYKRTIEPVVAAIADEMKRKFLTKTRRSQKQTILYFQDPFRLVPVNKLADIADRFTRNEIMSSNEVRQVVGLKPVLDPRADELRNKNINAEAGQEFVNTQEGMDPYAEEEMPEEGMDPYAEEEMPEEGAEPYAEGEMPEEGAEPYAEEEVSLEGMEPYIDEGFNSVMRIFGG